MSPLVSIIIPHYNRIQLFRLTVNSIKLQTYKNIEVIVVDDGSNADDIEQLSKLCTQNSFILLHRLRLPKGPSTCRNFGVENANGKYLIFLDSDDLLTPFCVEQRVFAMENHPQTDVGIFKMAMFTDDAILNVNNVFNKDISQSNWISSFLKNDIPWNVTCPIWKKTTFEAIGGFDSTFLFMEDPEIHLRLVICKQKSIQTFYNLPVDCFYRINNIDQTKGSFYYNSIYYRILFYNKIFKSPKLNGLLNSNLIDYKEGILNILKKFLFARTSEFPTLVNSFKSLIEESNVFSFSQKKKLFCFIEISSSKSLVVKFFRLKGIAFRLLTIL